MECAICLNPIDGTSSCHTDCGHTFHSTCVFKAVRTDPRCPLCRHELLPQESAPKRQLTIEIDGTDFAQFSATVARDRRNYNARRRRLEQRDQSIKAMRDEWKKSLEDLNMWDDRLERCMAAHMRMAHHQPDVRTIKLSRIKSMRREARLKKIYDDKLLEKLGEEPPSPLESLLQQNEVDTIRILQ